VAVALGRLRAFSRDEHHLVSERVRVPGGLFGEKGGSVADNKPAIGCFGPIIGGRLFLLASSALALHARRRPHGERRHSRVPVVWLEGLNTRAWEANLFQVGILVIFVALPVAGIIRCTEEAESGDICELDTKLVCPK
jgi:hypothetical protein